LAQPGFHRLERRKNGPHLLMDRVLGRPVDEGVGRRLGQIADARAPGDVNQTGRRGRLAGQNEEQRRLAHAVWSHQADLAVAGDADADAAEDVIIAE